MLGLVDLNDVCQREQPLAGIGRGRLVGLHQPHDLLQGFLVLLFGLDRRKRHGLSSR